MDKDQIELLTEERSRDVRHVLDTLPLTSSDRSLKQVRKSISDESEDPAPPGEGPMIQAFLAGLNWVMYALAIGAAVLLTWATGSAFHT